MIWKKISEMMAVFLLEPLRLEPQHLHDRQDVVDERFFFSKCGLITGAGCSSS